MAKKTSPTEAETVATASTSLLPDDCEYISPRALSLACGYKSPNWSRKLIKNGDLQGYTVCGCLRVRLDDAVAFIRANTKKFTPQKEAK